MKLVNRAYWFDSTSLLFKKHVLFSQQMNLVGIKTVKFYIKSVMNYIHIFYYCICRQIMLVNKNCLLYSFWFCFTWFPFRIFWTIGTRADHSGQVSPFTEISICILRRDHQKYFLWEWRLWVGRQKDPIIGYAPKNDKKK